MPGFLITNKEILFNDEYKTYRELISRGTNFPLLPEKTIIEFQLIHGENKNAYQEDKLCTLNNQITNPNNPFLLIVGDEFCVGVKKEKTFHLSTWKEKTEWEACSLDLDASMSTDLNNKDTILFLVSGSEKLKFIQEMTDRHRKPVFSIPRNFSIKKKNFSLFFSNSSPLFFLIDEVSAHCNEGEAISILSQFKGKSIRQFNSSLKYMREKEGFSKNKLIAAIRRFIAYGPMTYKDLETLLRTNQSFDSENSLFFYDVTSLSEESKIQKIADFILEASISRLKKIKQASNDLDIAIRRERYPSEIQDIILELHALNEEQWADGEKERLKKTADALFKRKLISLKLYKRLEVHKRKSFTKDLYFQVIKNDNLETIHSSLEKIIEKYNLFLYKNSNKQELRSKKSFKDNDGSYLNIQINDDPDLFGFYKWILSPSKKYTPLFLQIWESDQSQSIITLPKKRVTSLILREYLFFKDRGGALEYLKVRKPSQLRSLIPFLFYQCDSECAEAFLRYGFYKKKTDQPRWLEKLLQKSLESDLEEEELLQERLKIDLEEEKLLQESLKSNLVERMFTFVSHLGRTLIGEGDLNVGDYLSGDFSEILFQIFQLNSEIILPVLRVIKILIQWDLSDDDINQKKILNIARSLLKLTSIKDPLDVNQKRAARSIRNAFNNLGELILWLQTKKPKTGDYGYYFKGNKIINLYTKESKFPILEQAVNSCLLDKREGVEHSGERHKAVIKLFPGSLSNLIPHVFSPHLPVSWAITYLVLRNKHHLITDSSTLYSICYLRHLKNTKRRDKKGLETQLDEAVESYEYLRYRLENRNLEPVFFRINLCGAPQKKGNVYQAINWISRFKNKKFDACMKTLFKKSTPSLQIGELKDITEILLTIKTDPTSEADKIKLLENLLDPRQPENLLTVLRASQSSGVHDKKNTEKQSPLFYLTILICAGLRDLGKLFYLIKKLTESDCKGTHPKTLLLRQCVLSVERILSRLLTQQNNSLRSQKKRNTLLGRIKETLPANEKEFEESNLSALLYELNSEEQTMNEENKPVSFLSSSSASIFSRNNANKITRKQVTEEMKYNSENENDEEKEEEDEEEAEAYYLAHYLEQLNEEVQDDDENDEDEIAIRRFLSYLDPVTS